MATTQELIDYYANLLILQYRGKPRAYATIQALATMPVMDQLPTGVMNAFDLSSCGGVLLDTLGIYIGVSRNQFSFSGPVTLSDTDYRTLLNLKIIQNANASDLKTIVDFLYTAFGNSLQLFDYKDMALDYVLNSAIGNNTLLEVFIQGGFLPRPMGVKLRTIIYNPTLDNFFGFRTYDAPEFQVEPFNNYDSYNTTWPWLTYDYVVNP
jgi:hypothetical protein